MKGKKLAQLIGVLCVAVFVILGVFLAFNLREDDGAFSKGDKPNTEAQNILAKDLDRNYPATVREVVRLYSRISSCYHNETISEEELRKLAEFQRKLFDEEFLENNPLDTFTNNLANEIAVAKQTEYEMVSWRVQKQSSVKTWESGENHFASIIACYTMYGDDYTRTYEEFLLREDENGRWKIVGWRLTDPVEIED
ncbi:MAG: hypothetical protein J6J42_04650 [Lachnospiraceae bacterium]|nr:hypothetical protein [Lachnospiraceae bacterium]MBP3609609.1 hypothetical protein [Lachnospiraceae bacterium]